MKTRAKTYVLLWLCALNTACQPKKDSLLIAVASSLEPAISALVSDFNRSEEFNIKLISGSTGKLTHQIEQGAPYNLFLAADTLSTHRLYLNGITAEKPTIFAKGKLAFCSAKYDPDSLLANARFANHKIAIADPNVAPFGMSALSFIADQSLTDVVYGQNVSQVNQYIATSTVDGGFTCAGSIQQIDGIKCSSIPTHLYPPIYFSAAILARQPHAAAQQFIKFMFSAKGQDILAKYHETSDL